MSEAAKILEPQRKYTIFVVDDEELVTFAIARALGRNPQYDIHTFNAPVEAARKAATMPVDMVIADYIMPGMTGIELLTQVRQLHPAAARIMITAYADKESVIKAINDVGLFFYIEKPWNNEDLRLVVQRGLDQRDLIGQLEDRVRDLEKANKELKDARAELIRRERLSAIGTMASSIIHDFKGPMTAILGFSELLAMDEVPKEDKAKIYETLRGEIDRMVGMTGDVLAFTRGEIAHAPELTDIGEFLSNTTSALSKLLGNASVELVHEFKVQPKVQIDPQRFRRVIENLISNSCDAMQDGGKIFVRVVPDEDGKIHVEVEDTGRGIPPEVRDKLFEPFATFGKAHGTGLGMAIARKVVEAHGGTIELVDKDTPGAMFRITIPASG
ncbi:MAG: hybrid sensor histidine kinase/response regulator [Deltaproteobacteria bacterium]|nr:hybrid sensor histidine kinase/response regulator [Deltaproteobacteria bacterium]